MLDRLLDGLDVSFEPLVISDHRGRIPHHRRQETTVVRRESGATGILELAGGATVRFLSDSVVIVPPPRAGRRWAPPPNAPIEAGPDAPVARWRVRATYQGSVGLFDHLREPVVEGLTADDPLRRAFGELLDEIETRRPGYRAMAESLLRRCLILLLRRLARDEEHRLRWLAPLEDPRLGRAVAAMQDHPGHAFTLPGLAEVAGMSRSVFAARFAETLGQSPIEFLKRLRLVRATRLLRGTDLPVKTVATRVGYSSRSSFTRAFVACHGVGPMAFRVGARGPAGPGAHGRAGERVGPLSRTA